MASKPVRTRSGVDSGLESARAAGGGIQAGANQKAVDSVNSGFGNPITQIGGAIKAVGRFLNPPRKIGNSSRDAHNLRAYEYDKANRKSKP